MAKNKNEKQTDSDGRYIFYGEDFDSIKPHNRGLNFLDIMRKYMGKKGEPGAISQYWKEPEKTFNSHINDYETKILPSLDLTKALADYTSDDADQFIFNLIHKHNINGNSSTMIKCKRLFWDVYSAGFEHGEYDDQLFWKKLGIISDSEKPDETRKKQQLIRKSFSTKEEILLVNYFKELDPEKSDGEDYGVLLMFALGLRNAEAAGLSFENVLKVPEKEFYVAYIIKTTEGDTNVVKPGGKTYNATRIIPIWNWLYKIIDQRRQIAIVNLIKEENLSVQDAVERVNSNYPVACRGLDFKTRCSRNDITKRARKIFKEKLSQDENQLAAVEGLRNKLKDYGIEEKDVTAYICRRNQATHLYGLGLSPSQIQYYIGHEVEDDNELRSYFTNPDRLEELHNILLKHPLATLFGEPTEDTVTITLKPQSDNYLRIVASEPNQFIKLTASNVSKNNPIRVTISDAPAGKDARRYIDIHSKTNEVYKKYSQEPKSETESQSD